MPMDYDDNDTSRHNLQLASEGRTRSSSALRPYDFPKFDFDEGLQGHLRFDSLVETEVFLGIQSQEDNQWIEDFSRSTNGMEFNPTPADSCSISRRNNVWSEATSSESVEMLLKSVGQEEIMAGASITPESEVADDQHQGSLSKQPETSNKQNERKDVFVADPESTLPLDEAFNNYPDSRRNIEEKLEDPLPTSANVDSVCGELSNIHQTALCGEDGTSTNEAKNIEQPKASVEKSTVSRVEGDSSDFSGNTDNFISKPSLSETSKQANPIISHESCSSDEQQKDVSIKKGEDTESLEGKAGVVSIQIGTGISSHGLDPVHGGDSQEANLASVRDSELKSFKEDDKHASFTTSILTSRNEEVLATSNDVDEAKNVEGCCDASIITGKGSGVSLHVHETNVSIEGVQENLVQRQDIGKIEEANKEVSSSDLRNIDSEDVGTLKVDHLTQSLDVGGDFDGNNSVPMLQRQISGELESANHLSPLPMIDASSAPNDCCETGKREPVAFGSILPEKDTEEAGTKNIDNANSGTEVEDSSKAHVYVGSDSVRIPLSELDAKSHQLLEKADDVYFSGTPVDGLIPQPHSGSKSSSKGSVDAHFKSDDDNLSKSMTKEEAKEGAQTAEIDKACCGSPTIISSSEPLLTEKDNEEEEKGSLVTNEFVKDINSISEGSKSKDLSGEDSSFTFKVNALPDTSDIAPTKSWSPFPDVEKGKVVEGTVPSGKAKMEKTPSQKTPRQTRVSDGETGVGTSKSTSERKGRRGPAKGMTKETIKKGNQSKGANKENASGKVEKISNNLLSSPSSPQAQFGLTQAYANIEASNQKPSVAAGVPTSSLPDLNSSALNNSTSQSGPFRQPFTDLQQVQLRAQIFVYGSLIQGTAPDEACMVSAFGASDVGRNTWEPIWRVAVERVRSQKSSSAAAETPSRSHSGARTSDAVKQGSHLSKVITTPMSRASSKDTPSAVSNPMIPLSSPLWNIVTPSRDSLAAVHKGPVLDFQQAITPGHSFQTPPIRSFVGLTSWPSQTCFPGPLLASPQTSTFSSSAQFRPVTTSETVKLTPVKDKTAVLASSVKHMASSPTAHAVSPCPALGGVSPLQDPKSKASGEQHSVDTKPRKRKKVPASNFSQVSLVSEAQPQPVVVSDVTNLPPSPIGVSTPACRGSDVILSKPVADPSRFSSIINHTKKDDSNAGKAASCSEDTFSKVAEAKSQAEDAADLATAAVSHCEDLWSQLVKQKDSGLTSETEAKLASAAVAIAAAASVAKAAAAAAKIACNAALQAKLMADEAFLFGRTSGVLSSTGKSSNDVHNIGTATPASILKSNNVADQSSSILVAAKEAAKRRVEAASAASRQAENLDAIVKAAELAAKAVSQAGKIATMVEPLPLNELIKYGPEGYSKLPQSSALLAEKVRDGILEQSGAVSLVKAANLPAIDPAEKSVEKERSKSTDDVHVSEGLNGSLNSCLSLSDGFTGSQHLGQKDFKFGIDHKASDASNSEPDALQSSTNFKNDRNEFTTHPEDGIKEGSLVEVFKPGNGRKSAWYTANLLTLGDGKAYVCYNDLMSEEGSGHLQEWVTLESKVDKAPIIRPAHPLSSLQYQQTRKRRRAALGDYAWCVGDKVDVWIDDCWWEGEVTEKDEKDETTLKVNIPAQEQTPTVRAWNLRASRSWINGKWIEWSSSRGVNASEKSDAPQEKRQKLGTPLVATKEKDKESTNVDLGLGKPQQSKSFTLSARDRTFDIGKTTNDDNKRTTRRPLRTNQQKEGSRVVFGVPKPTGKKRKFMEVSKHFPANKSDKSTEVNDSVKFTKYLIPQGGASRGLKGPSRNDSKEKRPAEPRPRVMSTRKAQRTLPQRGNPTSRSAQDADKPVDDGVDVDSVGHDENTSDKSIDHGSVTCDEGTEAPLSSLLSHSLSSTSKKTSLLSKSDRLNRGKLVPSGGKLSKIEEDKAYSANTSRSTLDTSEPRRSNRRIQPTHRLLEGLQSSMVIPKMPSVSHDKGRRNLPSRGK